MNDMCEYNVFFPRAPVLYNETPPCVSLSMHAATVSATILGFPSKCQYPDNTQYWGRAASTSNHTCIFYSFIVSVRCQLPDPIAVTRLMGEAADRYVTASQICQRGPEETSHQDAEQAHSALETIITELRELQLLFCLQALEVSVLCSIPT